MSLIEANLFEY